MGRSSSDEGYGTNGSRWVAPGWVIAFAATAIAVVGLLLFNSTSQSLRRAQAEAEIDSRNLAEGLEGYVRGAIHEIDITLQAAAEEIARQKAAGGIDGDALDDYLIRQQTRLPMTIAVRMADRDGFIRHGSEARQTPLVNIADRPDFIAHRDARPKELVFGPPIKARIDQQWAMRVSRTLTDLDGSFAGMVYALVAIDRISEAFARIEAGPKASITLYDQDRRIVSRWPPPKDLDSVIGVKVASPQVMALMAQGRDQATYEAAGTVDGVRRVFSFKRLTGYPLYISVGLPEETFLAEWRTQRNAALWQFALITVILTTLAVSLGRAWLGRERRLSGAAETHAASAALLRSLLDTSPIAVRIADRNGRRIVYANLNYAGMINATPDEVVGMDASEHYVDRAVFDGVTARLARQQAVKEELVELSLGTNQPRWVVASYYPILYEGNPAVLGWFYDVTALKNADTTVIAVNQQLGIQSRLLERSNAELEQFAYVVSHDLREPLRMVSSYLALIERRLGEKASGDIKEFIDFAIDGAKRMDGMVLALLEYSRIGRQTDAFESVSLDKALADGLANLKVAIRDAGASIACPQALPSIKGDHIELTRLFQNLIANAIKYRAPDRPPEVTVTCAGRNGEWEIGISDNGIGIAPENRERAFEIFQRLGQRGPIDGSGIGLAVCRKIVEHHHGRIWIDGERKTGTAVLFTLPEEA